jgi:hypothetical protein
MNFQEILVNAVLPMVKAVGKAQLAEILGKIKTNNTEEVYVNTLKSVHSSFALLKEVAVKTKTKIDDGIIDAILESVSEAAAADDIAL